MWFWVGFAGEVGLCSGLWGLLGEVFHTFVFWRRGRTSLLIGAIFDTTRATGDPMGEGRASRGSTPADNEPTTDTTVHKARDRVTGRPWADPTTADTKDTSLSLSSPDTGDGGGAATTVVTTCFGGISSTGGASSWAIDDRDDPRVTRVANRVCGGRELLV